MKQGKMKWRKITLAALTAVLVGGMTGPLGLEAAGLHAGPGLHRAAPAATDGTPAAVPETPEAGTETEPTAKAVARVRVDGVDTEYMDIKEAWAAVNGRTAELTLLDSVTTAAAMNTAFELTGGSVTLDLNGYQWTYQYTSEGETGPATVDLIELRGDASLTIKGGTGSAMVYAGSSNYKGACLYATGSSTLTIEGGTYSSNVSAPVYVDGATLNVKGGVFKAAGAKESAITMNNGTFSMTGGEVQVGTLTLNNTNGSQDVNIGGDSQLSGIETKGKEALSIKDTLADGYGYRSAASNQASWVSDKAEESNSVGAVRTDDKWIKSVTIKSSSDKTEFNYEEVGTLTLTAEPGALGSSHTADDLIFEWSVSYGNKTEQLTADADHPEQYTYDNTGKNAGNYTYHVTIKAKDGTDQSAEDSYSIKVNKIPVNITDSKYKNSYTYGDKIEESEKDFFTLDSNVSGLDSENFDWNYKWYVGDSVTGDPILEGDDILPESLGEGQYTVRVEAVGTNHVATKDFTINIVKKDVTPEISADNNLTKVYDGSTTLENVKIELTGTNPVVSFTATADFDTAYVGENKTVTVSGITLPDDMKNKYNLTDTNCTATTGSITKAPLNVQIDVQSEPYIVDKAVTVTVTVRNADSTTPASRLTANDIQLNVSGGTNEDTVSRLSGQDGVFTARYTASSKGDRGFSATVTNTNYEVKNAASKTVTFAEEIIKSSMTLSADKREIIYGDQVVYTATVNRVDGRAGDPLIGGVQFYIDEENASHKVGNPYSIRSSGDTATITLTDSVLTVGDHTIIAVFTSDSAEESRATVTTKVTEKPVEVAKTAVSVKASDSEVTYGDEVTYTATVTKEGGKTGDALNGGVQFYIDEVESSNRVGSAQTIKASGDQVKVKLGKSDLTAGDHKIIAVYTPGSTDTIEGAQAEATTKVEKKKLTWNTSGLRASKTAGTSGEAKVYGTLEVDGILDGEVKFEQPESMMTSGLKSAEAGTFKVSVVLEDKEEWKFDPKEPKNYELPEGDPEIRATVNALKELSDPPEAKDGNTYKLVMEEGLSTVPDGLKSTSFNTPVKIEQELKRILTSSGAYTEANTKVYDVMLQVSTDEGKTWTEANANNFPAGGVVVTLPYPGGTGRHTHNFAVAHMFGESLFGHTSGTVEVPNVTKTDNGLRFRVTGLSPIAVSWTDGAGGRVSGTSSSSGGSAGSAINRLLGVQTGDDSPILLYIGLAVGCTLLLVILLTVLVVRRKKNTR